MQQLIEHVTYSAKPRIWAKGKARTLVVSTTGQTDVLFARS